MKIKVGQTVRVDKVTDYKPNGVTYLKDSKPKIAKIEQVYVGGK